MSPSEKTIRLRFGNLKAAVQLRWRRTEVTRAAAHGTARLAVPLGCCASLRNANAGYANQHYAKEGNWWTRGDSNPWPRECDSRALPAELRAHSSRTEAERRV